MLRVSKKIRNIKNIIVLFFKKNIIISIFKANLWLLRESLLSTFYMEKKSFKNINIKNIFISYIGNNNIHDVDAFFYQNQYWGNLPIKLLNNKIKTLFVHISLKNTNPFKLRKFIKNINSKSSYQEHILFNSFLKSKSFINIILSLL